MSCLFVVGGVEQVVLIANFSYSILLFSQSPYLLCGLLWHKRAKVYQFISNYYLLRRKVKLVDEEINEKLISLERGKRTRADRQLRKTIRITAYIICHEN